MKWPHYPDCECPSCVQDRLASAVFIPDSLNHPPGCGCWDCLAYLQEYRLVNRYQPEPPPKGTIVHQLGRIALTRYIYRKQQWYEVTLNGKLIAQARDNPWEALQIARRAMPPKPMRKHYGEIIAYRGWNLFADILTPLSRTDDYESWSGPVASVSHVSPDGSDGFWAVKLDYVKEWLFRSYNPMIHGLVGLSGRVIEHEHGYRAQRVVIRLLRVVPPVGDIIIRALEERYQCQVFRQKKKS